MRRFRLRTLLIFVFFSLLISFFDSRNLLSPFKSAFSVVTTPVQYNLYTLRNSALDAFSILTFWRSGEARVKDLEMRNAELLARLVELDSVKEENGSLRLQLGIKDLRPFRMTIGKVVGRARYLEIDVASAAVSASQSVVYGNNLVGRIKSVSKRSAFVELPTDADSKIPVAVGKNRVFGLAIGQFNSGILLTRVAQNEGVSPGDLVTSSGEGQTYAPGILLGKVGKITSKETDLFTQAEILPAIDYGKLVTVFVISD